LEFIENPYAHFSKEEIVKARYQLMERVDKLDQAIKKLKGSFK